MNILKTLFGRPGKNVSAAELEKRMKKDDAYIIIDVRTPGEFKSGTIPSRNTVNVEMSRVYQYITDEKVNGDMYVLCASGSRSGVVQKMLAMQGIDVINIAGGMAAWHRQVKK